MNRNFLNAFANLISKEYGAEYNRDDVIKFHNDLLDKDYEREYIDTQMDFVLTFFRHWLKSPDVLCEETHLGWHYSLQPDSVH
jgi:hypothetical protein